MLMRCFKEYWLRQFAIRQDSGGKGQHHGVGGIIRRIRFLEKTTENIISSHRRVAPLREL